MSGSCEASPYKTSKQAIEAKYIFQVMHELGLSYWDPSNREALARYAQLLANASKKHVQ